MGKKCIDFHPKMCPMSISKLECFDSKCNLCHVKGTKRKRDQIPTSKKTKLEAPKSPAVTKSSEGKQQDENQSSNSNLNTGDQHSFLEQINLLRKEFQEVVEQKMNLILAATNPPVKPMQPTIPSHPHMNMFQPFIPPYPHYQSKMFHYPYNQIPMQPPMLQSPQI